MNRERAETHLRQLAEAELRRARTSPAPGAPRRRADARLALVAQALVAVGAVDVGTADQIRADFEAAIAVRQLGLLNQARPGQRGLSPEAQERLARLMRRPSRRTGAVARPRAPWRIVPVGQVIRSRDDSGRWELPLVAYVQSAGGARFTVAGRDARRLTVVDDRGASYQIGWLGGFDASELRLRPDPPHQIRWLDVARASGEPATRIDLDPQVPAPEVTVTRNAHSPGELLLDFIAARILSSGAVPLDDLEHPPAGAADLRAFVGDGPGDIVAALLAAGALPPASPVPGQLAALCDRLGIPGHGITEPPAAGLPEPWQSLLTRPRREPRAGPAPGILAAAVAELPGLDGARFAILGVHHGKDRTIVHMLASGVTPEDDWEYARGVRPLPVLWIRDSRGRWHATRTHGLSPSANGGEGLLWLELVPPLDRGTAWIDVIATGRSAQARIRLPLSRK